LRLEGSKILQVEISASRILVDLLQEYLTKQQVDSTTDDINESCSFEHSFDSGTLIYHIELEQNLP